MAKDTGRGFYFNPRPRVEDDPVVFFVGRLEFEISIHVPRVEDDADYMELMNNFLN